VRLLLDTHIFIWACAQPVSLSAAQREAISNEENKILISAGSLPKQHYDPFDRMLIAQAQLEGLTIMTADRKFKLYQATVF
jgi:PIN domain nuclease of toxin-antitoxin system